MRDRRGRCVSVEVEPALRDRLKAAADARGQSLAAYLRVVLAAAAEAAPEARLENRVEEIERRVAVLERGGRRGRL